MATNKPSLMNNMKVSATVHLTCVDVEQLIRATVEEQTGKKVKAVRFKVENAQDDRFSYVPARLTGVDVEVEFS